MKSSPQLKQWSHTPASPDPAHGGLHDLRNHAKECAFARAIPADDTKYLTSHYFESNLPQRKEFVIDDASLERSDCVFLERIDSFLGHSIPDRNVLDTYQRLRGHWRGEIRRALQLWSYLKRGMQALPPCA